MAKREKDIVVHRIKIIVCITATSMMFVAFYMLLSLSIHAYRLNIFTKNVPPTFPLTYTNPDTLLVGMALPQGVPLRSNNSAYYLVVQGDGNLVLYQSKTHSADTHSIWSSGTAGVGVAPFQLKLKDDGNLVLYDADGEKIWAPPGIDVNPHHARGQHRHLVVQDDGNVVLYNQKMEPRWATGTNGDSHGRYTFIIPNNIVNRQKSPV